MRAWREPLVAIITCVSLAITTQADDKWTQFRGPKGQGQAPDADLPIKWNKDNIKWRTPIHDKGWSSPVIWGDQIWLTTASATGHKLYVLCIDFKTGKILKDMLLFDVKEPQKAIEKNSYASPTPVIEEGRVYVHFGAAGTACLDTKTGKKIWTREDLECNHWRGPASSPIIEGNRLFLIFDGYDKQYVIALDKRTGETLWRRDRSQDYDYRTDNGDRKKAYCTPAIFDIGGKRHLICPSAVATVAYDPETGKPRWTFRSGGMNASAVPAMRNGVVYLTNGMGMMYAVRPDPAKGNHVAEEVWTNRKGMSKAPSPLLIGNRLFVINDKTGVASWLNAETGEAIWSERVGGAYSASPLYAKGRIYVFSEFGKINVLAAKDKYEKLASMEDEEGYMASPAVVGNTMILRSKKALYRIER